MSVSRRSVRVLSVLLLALTAACDDPVAPEDVAGTYILQTVAGDSLPTVLYQTQSIAGTDQPTGGGTVTVLADTLRLHPDGSGSRSTLQTYQSETSKRPDEPHLVETPIQFRVDGDRIEISFNCPPNALALCIQGPHLVGALTETRLRVGSAVTNERVPLIYERMDVLRL